MEEQRTYLSIDLKSFYASVECRERGLDPMTVNLVVADPLRTEKTICLAVSPALKRFGVPGRPRLFEVVQQVARVNAQRAAGAPGGRLRGTSTDAEVLFSDTALAVDYLVAPPRMALYMEYSTRIYQIYLKYIAPEDIHVYSIDEVFLDVTHYLRRYGLDAPQLAKQIIRDVQQTTGITAAGGIGTNLYLSKVAMDIVAKHVESDPDGVRIAQLDEQSYRRQLWEHRPLTDFWRLGRGYAKKLEACGLFTMGDIARCSLRDEDLLYKMFGVNAELLIDHAWGWEPCTVAHIKAYKPENNSVGSGQVLHSPYSAERARLVVREMTDLLALDLVDKGLVTDQLVLTVGYDILSAHSGYQGPLTVDSYGRSIPKHAHGTVHLERYTASSRRLLEAVSRLYDSITDPKLLVRRVNIVAANVLAAEEADGRSQQGQLTLFDNADTENKADVKEKDLQKTLLMLKKKYGKNAVLKGSSLEEDATARDRNSQIGGHKA